MFTSSVTSESVLKPVCIYTCHPQIRNKLNHEQNSKLQQQKELLNKRNMEVTLMDKRISELRERLYKKKAEARQKENLPVRLGPLNTFPIKTLFVEMVLTKAAVNVLETRSPIYPCA